MRNLTENIELLKDGLINGDEKSYSQLFVLAYDSLYDYGMKISNDEYLTQNAIHDFFVNLWNSRRKAFKVGNISSYIFVSVRNSLKRSMAKQSKSIPLNDFTDFEYEFSQEDFIIKDEENSRITQNVVKVINKLPPQQRAIIYMRYYQGLDYDEIAEIMDLKYQSVRNLMSYTLKRIRTDLQEVGITPVVILTILSKLSVNHLFVN